MSLTIQLFSTCLVDTLYPASTLRAAVAVLQRAGARVEIPPGQTCCGQPAFNAGLRRATIPVAQHTIRLFEKTSGPLVVPSGSCAAMLKHSYPELFAADPAWLPRAQALAERVYEFSQFLVDVLGVVDLGARFPAKLAYHPSCHLQRGLGIDRQPRLLLAHVAQAEIVPLPHEYECCGFGGVFSAEHAALSSEMVGRKIAYLGESQALRLVACDAGCITNINGALHRRRLLADNLAPEAPGLRAVHLADILNFAFSGGR